MKVRRSNERLPGAGKPLLPALLLLSSAWWGTGCDRGSGGVGGGAVRAATPEEVISAYLDSLKSGDAPAAWARMTRATQEERAMLQRGEAERLSLLPAESRAVRKAALGVPEGVEPTPEALAVAAMGRELRRPERKAFEAARRVTGVFRHDGLTLVTTEVAGGGEETIVLVQESGEWRLDAPASRALAR